MGSHSKIGSGWIGCSLTLVVAAGLAPRKAAAAIGETCAATPEQAASHVGAVATSGHGYRLMGRRDDPAHARSWALVARCDQPQLPWTVVPIAPAAARPATPHAERGRVVIAAGDTVLFRNTAANASIAIEAVAEQSAASGERIRVRLKTFSQDPAALPRRVDAIAVSAGEVEGSL